MSIPPQMIVIIVAGYHKLLRLGINVAVDGINPLNKTIIKIRITNKREGTHCMKHVPSSHSVLFLLSSTPEIGVDGSEFILPQMERVSLWAQSRETPIDRNKGRRTLRMEGTHSSSGGRHGMRVGWL